ncbi:conserved membrane hypothetical protein [Luteimonas sp. 9C]|uniref:hypothetical protein n=1 Tax=Luteimonas sp. 9C TaxID=2653148 RepID=UPI0012F0364D|nr:hypothetical protein [Luteimonas sp. 9C]VXC09237.1 conserved membrane hypothetical protein [Luteimonas sp. 9C]
MSLRTVIGLAVSVSLQMLLGLLAASLFPPVPSGVAPVSTAVQAGVLSSTGSAFAARQPFMRAALVLWAVGWLSSVLVVQRLGGGQFTFADAASANAMAIVVSGIATVLGVRAGRRLDRHVRGPAANATP